MLDGSEPVAVSDSLFDHGADSLAMTLLREQLNTALQIDLALPTLIAHPSPTAMATAAIAALSRRLAADPQPVTLTPAAASPVRPVAAVALTATPPLGSPVSRLSHGSAVIDERTVHRVDRLSRQLGLRTLPPPVPPPHCAVLGLGTALPEFYSEQDAAAEAFIHRMSSFGLDSCLFRFLCAFSLSLSICCSHLLSLVFIFSETPPLGLDRSGQCGPGVADKVRRLFAHARIARRYSVVPDISGDSGTARLWARSTGKPPLCWFFCAFVVFLWTW
jgi:hypothetical protein